MVKFSEILAEAVVRGQAMARAATNMPVLSARETLP